MAHSADFGFVRIIVRGADRARFLHNFCTNNIKAMTSGQVLEAFFVNVQAKVLAHGYIASFEDHHEIWMLPGDPTALVKHLSRYVISEDVTVELAGGVTKIYRLENRPRKDPFQSAYVESGCGTHLVGDRQIRAIWFTWSSEALIVAGGSTDAVEAVEALPDLGLQPIESHRVEQLRIEERFPIAGRDLTSDHLAPEADRNSLAISYTKGCYLGQEPIARIDALGHVNKTLKMVTLRPESQDTVDVAAIIGSKLRTSNDVTDDRNVAGTLTSAVFRDGEVIGLSVIRLSSLNQPLQLPDPNGRVWFVTVQ